MVARAASARNRTVRAGLIRRMEHRALGRSGLQVAPLAFGGNVFGWTIDEPTSFALLDAFVDAGFDLVDTADVYSRWVPGNQGGESETIIGNWMRSRGNRDRVIVATKVGGGGGRKQLSTQHITAAVEDSLRRLRTDRIDLYQAHFDDAETPLEETLATFATLVQAGKVRAIGASNYTPERLAAGARGERARRPAALREHSAALQPLRPRRVRRRAASAVRRAASSA